MRRQGGGWWRSIATGLGVAALVVTGARAAVGAELPPGPNRDLVAGACSACHDVQYLIESAGLTRGQWDGVLDGMRQYGLTLSPAQRAKILDYLASVLGTHPPGAAAPLPPERR
jgi:mono/diheme cytochrome c family protein